MTSPVKYSVNLILAFMSFSLALSSFAINGNESSNLYDEYIYANDKWEKLGTQTVDLSNFYNKNETYTKEEVDAKVDIKANADNVYSKAEVDEKLDEKANSYNVYSKEEIDIKLDEKANTGNVYSKEETDAKIEASGVVVSSTEPTTNEKVWIDNENKVIYTKNDNGLYEEFYNESKMNKQNYSTEEQVIGNWFGKPIYRKVIETTLTATSDVLLGTIDNFDTLININGYVSISGYLTSLLQYWNDTLKSILQVKKKDGGIYLNASSNLLNQYVYVIVEYTKTTD
jgi:hypothetical protein